MDSNEETERKFLNEAAPGRKPLRCCLGLTLAKLPPAAQAHDDGRR